MSNIHKNFADGQDYPQATFSTKDYERLPSQETGNFQPQKNASAFSQNSGAVSSASPEFFSAVVPKPFFSGNSGISSANTQSAAVSKVGSFSFSGSETSFHDIAKSLSTVESRSFFTKDVANFPFTETKAPDSGSFFTQTREPSVSKNTNPQLNPVIKYSVNEEKIDIDPNIKQNLILMDIFNEKSELDPRNILFYAVQNCSLFEEFIIEKKLDNNSGEM